MKVLRFRGGNIADEVVALFIVSSCTTLSFAGAKGLYEEFDGTEDKSTFFEDDGVPQ